MNQMLMSYYKHSTRPLLSVNQPLGKQRADAVNISGD